MAVWRVAIYTFFAVGCVAHQPSSTIEALKRQRQRLEGSVGETDRVQPYALDADMCSCKSNGQDSKPVLIDNWVQQECGGWGQGTRCVARLVQEVKRFAPFNRTLELADARFTIDSVRMLKKIAAGYLAEQKDTLVSVDRVIGKLEGSPSANGVTDAEVSDRSRNAAAFDASPDRELTLHIGVRDAAVGLVEDRSCACFKVKQARTLWDNIEDTDPAPLDLQHLPAMEELVDFMPVGFVEPSHIIVQVRTASSHRLKGPVQAQSRRLNESMDQGHNLWPVGQFEHYVDLAAEKYAKNHPAMTWFFLLATGTGVYFEPKCDSGPLFPPYAIQSSGCHWAPCSNVYNQGYSWPMALGGLAYWDSSPYGPFFTSSPETLAYFPGNGYGRQWPERTYFGVHPCGSSNSDALANNEYLTIYEASKNGSAVSARRLSVLRGMAGEPENEELYGSRGDAMEHVNGDHQVFFAPDKHVYDARLVQILYDLAEQGASVRRSTVFGTRLPHLKILGWNPESSNLQHMGVTLEFTKSVKGTYYKFLTLEMMSGGLMWTLGEAQPSKNYDYQVKGTMTYHNLSPAVVARYFAGQQGRVYKNQDLNCQTIAYELALRLAMHGRRLLLPATSATSHLQLGSGELAHGPSYAEWKHTHGPQFDNHFLASLAAILLILGLLIVLGRKALKYFVGDARTPKWNPQAVCAVGAVMAAMMGTVAVLPLAVGACWWKNKMNDKSEVHPDAVELNGEASDEAGAAE